MDLIKIACCSVQSGGLVVDGYVCVCVCVCE